MVEQIGKFGPRSKLPSPYEIRTKLLKNKVEGVYSIKAIHRAAWEKYGCTIMSDGWSNKKSENLINFLLNLSEGAFFYKSIDASDSIKCRDYLFQCIDNMVVEIREQHILQVITDNHASYLNVRKKLMEARKSLYCSPCAHCIDLMQEDIRKMKIDQETLEAAKGVIQFIYNHCWVLSLMEVHGRKRAVEAHCYSLCHVFLDIAKVVLLKKTLEKHVLLR